MTLSLASFTAPRRALGSGALLLATSGWGAMFIVSPPVLRHVDPLWFTLIRYTLSALVFAVLLLLRGRSAWQPLRTHAPALALRGLAGFGVFSLFMLLGLAHSVPAHGAVIMATVPMNTQLLRWLLDGQRPSARAFGTALLALAGVAMVSGLLLAPAGGDRAGTVLGDGLTLVGSLGWIVYTRGAARFAQLDVLSYTGLTAIASWPLLVLATLGASALGWSHRPTPEGLLQSAPALAYVGLVSSALCVLAFNQGVRLLGTVSATAFMNMVPVSALLMGMALGHRPATHEWLGLAMVVGALLVHSAPARTAGYRRSIATTPCRVPS
ncbi:DMT family transporter [Aquabacterium sp.]|uniref:DMT family transporter n=1 Tax=Aquabacterium sp. TaxID=1872578 RepID=UPI0037850CE9